MHVYVSKKGYVKIIMCVIWRLSPLNSYKSLTVIADCWMTQCIPPPHKVHFWRSAALHRTAHNHNNKELYFCCSYSKSEFTKYFSKCKVHMWVVDIYMLPRSLRRWTSTILQTCTDVGCLSKGGKLICQLYMCFLTKCTSEKALLLLTCCSHQRKQS